MRTDMAKVLVERPRWGSRAKSFKKGKQEDWDIAPKFEPMNRYSRKRASKQLNENLAPLKRFLHKNVGRPWDKVYAEMSAGVHRGNAVQSHIFQHVVGERGYVQFDVFEAHGIIWNQVSIQRQVTPVRTRHPMHPKFYVCPRTGLLRLAPETWPNERKLERAKPRLTPVTEKLWLAQMGHGHGLRYWILHLLPMQRPDVPTRYVYRDLQQYDDAWLGRRVHYNISLWRLYRTDLEYLKRGYWCKVAQPIGHKEARQYLSMVPARKGKAA